MVRCCTGGGERCGHPLTIHILGMNLPHTRDEPLGRNHPECQGKKGRTGFGYKICSNHLHLMNGRTFNE